MPRLTISLTDERHRALKSAAAQRGKTMGQRLDESLEYCGIKTPERAAELVAQARQRARLGEREPSDLAVTETRKARQEPRAAGRH